jgi:hypothetical protein
MVKEGLGEHQPLFQQIIPRAGCLKKLNQKNSVSTAILYFQMARKKGELTPQYSARGFWFHLL